MRRLSVWISVLALVLLAGSGDASAAAPVFGSVVAIGGNASDIALDEINGVLYIANFGTGAIDVLSLADNTIHTSISVPANPGAIALSPGSQYLLVAQYGNGSSSPQASNTVTSINLAEQTSQSFDTGDPPLGVAFAGNGQAIVVTTTSVLMMNPASGTTLVLDTFANMAMTLPVPLATFPGEIVQTALATSGDGNTVWGIASANTGMQIIYRYSAPANSIAVETYSSSPASLPRISSSADGSTAMVGYTLLSAGGYIQARYPNVLTSANITGVAVDSAHATIYGQFPDTFQPTGPPGSAGGTALPSMVILDADNLTYRDRVSIPQDMVGRALLNAAGTVLYAISESGVMILPVGNLNNYHRLSTSQESLLVGSSFCVGGVLSQSLTITDPGGGSTDFSISPSHAGVTITPSSGTTPATVQVQVDPSFFSATGTTAVTLTISSLTAVNFPPPVQLMVNRPGPSQHGTIVDQPGVLTDILPDPARNRFYVLRQDRNQLLVFDGTSSNLITTLRTGTTPNMMSFTSDGNYLMVANDNAQIVSVFDLNALAASAPIVLPGGHYARSIAQSKAATLALVRNEGPPSTSIPLACSGGCIDSINFPVRTAAPLPALGVWANSVSPTAVLTPSPSGGNILLASPDGNVLLYSAAVNGFFASRQDFTALSGGFAASDYQTYVVGNYTFDSSLVPTGTILASTAGPASGFFFTGQGGYIASGTSPSAPGLLEQIASVPGGTATSVLMTEAPLEPGTTPVATPPSVVASAAPSFTRTVAPLPESGTVIVLTTSGFTVMASSYPAPAPPVVSAVVSAADGTATLAPGSWVSIYGQNLSTVTTGGGQVPLATALGNTCMTENGLPVPLLFVSPGQVNAQLPYSIVGGATLSVYTPSGASGGFPLTVQPAAPSIFMSGTAGPETGIATIIRDDNGQLVTATNPIHPKDSLTIYLAGMGQTTPFVVEGQAAPSQPLAYAVIQPYVTLGTAQLTVLYAGLVPGEVGVYQINAYVPTGLPEGLSIPLAISQGGATTTVYVRVVTN